MADNIKRRRVENESTITTTNNTLNCQVITTQNSSTDGSQTVVLNQLPILSNQQLIYSIPQVQSLNANVNGQQYLILIPTTENVNGQSATVTLPIQKEPGVAIKSEGKSVIQVQQKTNNNVQYNSQVIEIQQPLNNELLIVKNEGTKVVTNKNNNLAWKSQLYRCEYKGCTEIFPSLHQKKLHLETHIFPESEEYKCSICNMLFKKAIERNRHITTHTIVNTYKCKECQETFPYYTTLIKHVEGKLCSKTNPLKCSFCKVKFYSTYDIAKHHKLVLKKCELCNTNVCGEQAYMAHKRTCKI